MLRTGWKARLPTRTKGMLIAAGAIYLSGAMGMEAVGDVITAYYGGDVSSTSARVALAFSTMLEETLEMLGILFLLYTLLKYAARDIDNISFSFGK